MNYLNMKVNSLGRSLKGGAGYQDQRDSYSTSLTNGDPQTLRLYETAAKKSIANTPEAMLKQLFNQDMSKLIERIEALEEANIDIKRQLLEVKKVSKGMHPNEVAMSTTSSLRDRIIKKPLSGRREETFKVQRATILKPQYEPTT